MNIVTLEKSSCLLEFAMWQLPQVLDGALWLSYWAVLLPNARAAIHKRRLASRRRLEFAQPSHGSVA
jgi:hypothetical protein